MLAPPLPLLALTLLAPLSVTSGGGEGGWRVALKPEEAGGYPGNPSTLALPLRQDLQTIALARAGERYHVSVEGGPMPIQLGDADLSLLVPRVPSWARHDDDLTRFALLQREFNRNEVKFGPVADLAEFKLANNCLKTDLWELMLDTKTASGTAMAFHGWFQFPREEYARVFEQLNGRPYEACAQILAEYPAITGMAAPLTALRRVVSESSVPVQSHADEAPIRFGEQKRKAKLVLTPDIASYADFAAPKNQPIRLANFSEPGFYDSKNPVQFDLAWLSRPVNASVRAVELVQGGGRATEVEVVFANGLRLLLADRDLAALPAREAAPDNDQDTLRLTFGLGTPDIYASLAERSAELASERPNWLLLLGPDGKHVDNHQTGVDRIFCWNEQGKTLHLYLVGYERIAVVAHLSLPLASE